MKTDLKHALTICVMLSNLVLSEKSLAVDCFGQNLPVCTWAGHSGGFITLGDTVRVIDFETLPDGSPSYGGVYITSTFNYTGQGVTFSAHLSTPYIAGNATFGYGLLAYTGSPSVHDWLIADLVNPAQGVGIYFRGGNTLRAYDALGGLIASVSYPANPGTTEFFLGIRSDVPIVRAIIDSGGESAEMIRFDTIHIPVPEPGSAALLLLAVPLILRRPRRRGKI